MKLVVEVIDAHDLMPKDGEGSASPFVEVEFENQLSRTRAVPKNLNPTWNHKLIFHLDQTKPYNRQTIEVSVYNERRPISGRNFLGRVRIPCSNIVKEGEEVYQVFPLEKKWIFSPVKGEIGLKLYFASESKHKKALSPSFTAQVEEISSSLPQVQDSTAATTSTDNFLENRGFTEKEIAEGPDMDAPEVAKEGVNFDCAVNSSVEAEAKSSGIDETVDVPKEESREPVEETAQQLHKHQAMQQPVISIKKRPRVTSLTNVHPVSSQVHSRQNDEDFKVKDTNPQLGKRWSYGGIARGWTRGGAKGEKFTSTYDLVEQMSYLYVRVVKAKEITPSFMTGSRDAYVEVKLGNYRGRTKCVEKKLNPEWDQVFAFSKERIQSSVLEVFVKDKEMVRKDDYLGRVVFDLNEVPTRVPPESPLAPQWYRLEDWRGEGKIMGDIMLAVWMGTQADEAFSDAWHSDAATVYGEGIFNVRPKVYVSPKLWYLRVNIIEAQDVIPSDRNRLPEVFVKAQVGNQVLRTKICSHPTTTPLWNEDLIFVVAEPFEEHLVITVEDHVRPEVLGEINLPLLHFDKRLDHRPVHSRWFPLEKHGFRLMEGDRRNELKFASRIHMRVCLEGGYHVLDESAFYTSDQRPTSRQLWKPPIGILEVGVLGAQSLLPMKMKDGHGSTDAYCVAKYGQKWVRTRTILNTFNPRWNEQYTWEVYDPCTVITLGVFDNCHLKDGNSTPDSQIGKVRVRLSMLEGNRTHIHSYPLLVLHPLGVKKMGELELAIRFTTFSLVNMIQIYGHPLLPKMHYLHPFTVNQLENLRYQAMNIVAMRLGRAEPPLRKEVVEYMLDVDSHLWSIRRSKANFFRIMSLLSRLISIQRWFNDVCQWKNPITSILVHVLFLILIFHPDLILPTMFLYIFFVGILNYRSRPRHPSHMDPQLSSADTVQPDELDEEFDTFPTSRSNDVVRMRYDRLRSIAGRIQTLVGDIAAQGERIQSLWSWRDPRATTIFIFFSLSVAIVLYATPFRLVAMATGVYCLRHPRFRSKLPSVPSNFFKRLPSKTDSLL
ncbi:FT-interacting protein 1-like [Neltuma alba]|uniref:FT-interacting protein 1-like n=1 Tax=Neltuma alba TaxID=207710 RepID=UPI0010A54A41|nr:FT-interacting protein 1-like [Prosopis alba]XP_028799776.1 FT-interacting protein 1-like [Prosopis alba]